MEDKNSELVSRFLLYLCGRAQPTFSGVCLAVPAVNRGGAIRGLSWRLSLDGFSAHTFSLVLSNAAK